MPFGVEFVLMNSTMHASSDWTVAQGAAGRKDAVMRILIGPSSL